MRTPAETAVMQLRECWARIEPRDLCEFGIITEVEFIRGGGPDRVSMRFSWKNALTHAHGTITCAPMKDFEYISIAAALLAELAALRNTPRMPAAKESSYAQREKLSARRMHRVGLTDTTEGAARAAAAG